MKNFLKKLYILISNKMVTAHLTDKGENLYLEVPYVEKDIAKNLGAKWDPVKKKWFIPNNMNIEPFKQWLPSEKESEDENLRAEYFYLAKTYRDCYECNKSTLVWAIILPEGFEAIDVDAMEDLEKKGVITESAIFCKNDYLSLVSHVTYISQAALDEINKYINYSLFQKRYSASVGYSYYRSICQHCNAAQGDNYTISKYNSTFLPINIDDFKKIQCFKIPQKIKVRAGTNTIDYGSNNLVVIRNIW